MGGILSFWPGISRLSVGSAFFLPYLVLGSSSSAAELGHGAPDARRHLIQAVVFFSGEEFVCGFIRFRQGISGPGVRRREGMWRSELDL